MILHPSNNDDGRENEDMRQLILTGICDAGMVCVLLLSAWAEKYRGGNMSEDEIRNGRPLHDLSRRGFVKAGLATSALAATGSLAACAPGEGDEEAQSSTSSEGVPVKDPYEGAEVFYTCCPPQCQNHNLKGYVVDGKLVKVESSEHNDCDICSRGYARTQMVNDPNRLTTPLLRDGEKGEGKWKEISWDEAYDILEEKIKEAIDTDGNQSISQYTMSGNFNRLTHSVADAFFSHLGGYTPLVGTLCCAAAFNSVVPIFGQRFLDPRNHVEKSDYLIVWGNNPTTGLQGYFQRMEKVVQNGGKMVTIDPIFTESASKSTEWLDPLPGTDAALALGMLKVIIEEELYDKDFTLAHSTAPCLVDKNTQMRVLLDEKDETSFAVYDTISKQIVRHDSADIEAALMLEGIDIGEQYNTEFELIYAESKPWDEQAITAECGVQGEDITRIAREYAQATMPMLVVNMGGYMRTENGTWATAAQCYLAVLTGHIGHAGDGILDIGGQNEVPIAPPYVVPEEKPEYPPIPLFQFGRSIVEESPAKINLIWFVGTSPMTQWPNTNMVREGLKKIPFVVVVDMYMTSTALYADLVLPVASVFEYEDVMAWTLSHWFQLCEKAIDPPGEAKSDLQIFAELAERFGLAEYFNEDPRVYIERVLEPSGVSYEELAEKKAIDVVGYEYIPYKDGEFKTPTTKAHLLVPAWQESGFKPVASYERAREDARNDNELSEKYPLFVVQRKTFRSVHSTFNNLEWMDEIESARPVILMNSKDAEARGVTNGDEVTVYNDRGEHTGIAEVGNRIKEGVVGLQNGLWEQQGGSSSHVSNDAIDTLGITHGARILC